MLTASTDQHPLEETMTTTSTHRPPANIRQIVPFAVAGTVTALALTAIGTIGGENDRYDATDWLTVSVPIVLVAGAVVFGLVVPRIIRGARASTGGLVLGVLALVSIVAFYLGLPAILAGAAAACAAAARTRRGWTPATAVAVALAIAATAAAVVLAFTG
jgi:hypothetical protein